MWGPGLNDKVELHILNGQKIWIYEHRAMKFHPGVDDIRK